MDGTTKNGINRNGIKARIRIRIRIRMGMGMGTTLKE